MQCHRYLVLLVFVCSFLCEPIFAETLIWDYQTPQRTPSPWNALDITQRADVLTPDGKSTLQVTPHYAPSELSWLSLLTFATPSALLPDPATITIDFWAKGESGTAFQIRITTETAVYLSATRTFRMTGEWQHIHVAEILAPRQPSSPALGQWPSVPRVLLSSYRAGQTYFFGPVTATIDASNNPPSVAPATLAVSSSGWLPLDTSDLYIRPGSALDFTPFADSASAGTYGHLTTNAHGEAVFAKRLETPVRFLSLVWLPSREFRRWTDKQIIAYADATVRQGYNLVRFHFLDDLLAANDQGAQLKSPPDDYPLPTTAGDIRLDPVALDRFQRLLAELKRRGVYWNIDLMTSFAGYTNGHTRNVNSQSAFNTKAQMFCNPRYRSNWKAAATRLLCDVNPYTGLALKDDPALAFLTCLNEQEILIPSRDYGSALNPAWHAYLEKKYATYAALYSAWSGCCGNISLPVPSDPNSKITFTGVPSINRTALTDTPAGRDMARCVSEIEVDMSRWYLDTLRDIGLRSDQLVTNWNMRPNLATVPARALFPLVSMNYYYAHPSSTTGAHPMETQESALSLGGRSFKEQCVARFLDRPFEDTEFGLVFWNPFRHEQGLLYGAGAALQAWTSISCFSQQVVKEGTRLKWFDTGVDPINRASEAVTAFAFRRGDIAPSKRTISIPLDDTFIFGSNRALNALDDELARLWPLCRVGITYGQPRVSIAADLTLSPAKSSSLGGDLAYTSITDTAPTQRLPLIVSELRKKNILPPENLTDPARGILQSDTGQITLNTATGGELQVRSPRLEGAVIKQNNPVHLDALTIEACDKPASVTLISLDSGPATTLRTADRLLLVFATDARNSGMTFTNASDDTLNELGTLPVLVRTGHLQIRIARSTPAHSPQAWSLHLDGMRADPIPVKIDAITGDLLLDIDTSRLPAAGPTPFFEIVP